MICLERNPNLHLTILQMGYWGKLDEKLEAQKLRKQGLSYREILTHIKVSKGTISLWCKDIELTEKQKIKLACKKEFGQHGGSIVAADNKRVFRQNKTRLIHALAKKEIGPLSKRNRLIAGITLYAGEGNKTDGQAGFANANPKIIRFMMNWFKEFCDVPLDKFRGAIWLHEELNEKEAKNFWSELTGIPENQFYKTYIAKVKSESKKVRKNIHKYGVFSIIFSRADTHRKIIGWISAVLDDKIGLVH